MVTVLKQLSKEVLRPEGDTLAKIPRTAVILYIYRISMVYMIYFRIRFFATGHTCRAPFWVFLHMRRMPSHIVTSILVLSKGSG